MRQYFNHEGKLDGKVFNSNLSANLMEVDMNFLISIDFFLNDKCFFCVNELGDVNKPNTIYNFF